MNAFGVELDVHLTKDGKLAVIHDGEISRVSDGSGKVSEMTLDELRAYNFAAKFPGGERFVKVAIPTLDEVYGLLAPRGLCVNVEIKANGRDFVRKGHDCAAAHGMRERVIYSSFNHWNLTDLLEYDG